MSILRSAFGMAASTPLSSKTTRSSETERNSSFTFLLNFSIVKTSSTQEDVKNAPAYAPLLVCRGPSAAHTRRLLRHGIGEEGRPSAAAGVI